MIELMDEQDKSDPRLSDEQAAEPTFASLPANWREHRMDGAPRLAHRHGPSPVEREHHFVKAGMRLSQRLVSIEKARFSKPIEDQLGSFQAVALRVIRDLRSVAATV